MAPSPAQLLTALPGISSAIQRVNRELRRLAEDDGPVVITGEHGTEKAFAAKILHSQSARAAGPLARISVSYSMPADAAERFRASDGGSLLVNIQRDLTDEVQYLLLEIANDRAFSDPATGALVHADARVFITTGLDLDALARRGELLPELADLAKNRRLHIPPVRERTEDIPALVRYAIERAFETGRTSARAADAQVLALFRQLKWQGNAEDLLLVTAEAAMNAPGEFITLASLPETFLAEVPHEILAAARDVQIPDAAPPSMVASREERKRRAAPPRARPAEPDPPTHPEGIAQPDPPTDPEGLAKPDEDTTPPEEVATLSEDSADSEIKEEMALDIQRRQLDRLIVLSRRLKMQSKLLARQLEGPLEDAAPPEPEPLPDNAEALAQAVEKELDQGLDSVLALRRLLAQLNRREQETLTTARDLYRRLLLAGRDEDLADHDFEKGAGELTSHLRQLDEVLERLSGRLPGGAEPSAQAAPSVAESMRAEEKNIIADALQRARRRAREEAVEASSGPLTKFLEKPRTLPPPTGQPAEPATDGPAIVVPRKAAPPPRPRIEPPPPGEQTVVAAPAPQPPAAEPTMELSPDEIRRLQAQAMAERDEDTQEFPRPDSGQLRKP